jgi:aerobic carbon-monoxide dehydrogenase large subunit
MTLFADRRGRVLGLKADLLVDAGAYGAGMGRWAPGWIGYQMTGPYAIRKAFIKGTSVYTNKVPLGPYRGAGRPEAAFFLERSLDLLADELKMDPVEVRRRNTSARPFTSPTELEIPAARPFLEAAVRALGYRKATQAGPCGFSMFVLIPETGSGEGARIRADAGRVKVWLGGNVHGQGHDAFVRTLLAEELRVPPHLVDLEPGDTAMLKEGMGSWGSRSAIMGGAALVEAARRVRQQVTKKAGRYTAKALLAGTFDAQVYHRESGNLNSFGANLATAEVDATGAARAREVRAYYDVGRPLNPAMVESQIVGGSAQAIGQVLYEGAMYDENGQPLAASLADAGVPTAVEMPRFVVKLAKARSSLPHGAKGVGESPTIGVPPALVRAIERATGKRLPRTPIPAAELAGNSRDGSQ